MDEGVRCLICMIVFCLCAIMQIIISSFKIAIDHINDSDLEELQKGDPAKAGCLERYHSDDHLLVISSSFLPDFFRDRHCSKFFLPALQWTVGHCRKYMGKGLICNSCVCGLCRIICGFLFWNSLSYQFQKAL